MKSLVIALALSFVACGSASSTSQVQGDGLLQKGQRFAPAKVTKISRSCVGKPDAVACRATFSYQVPCNAQYFRTQYIENEATNAQGQRIVESVIVAVILKQFDMTCEPHTSPVTRTFETRAYSPETQFVALENLR